MKKLSTIAITLIFLLLGNSVYPQKEEIPDSSKIIYVAQVSNLDDLFAEFKGHIVYADFWASWCASCIEEFTEDPELDKFLKSNNIIRLYIALEKTEQDSALILKSMERWKTLVIKYDLEGYNYYVQLRSPFFSGITEKIMKGKLSLPRYSIVDANGVIVEENAKRPSNVTGLIKQLSGYIEDKK
jgi:thiol-disulfide isomerase/thioredoxin